VSRSILGRPTFREPCSSLHQGEKQPDTELFLRIAPFIYYATCGVVEGKKKIVGGNGGGVGEIGQFSLHV